MTIPIVLLLLQMGPIQRPAPSPADAGVSIPSRVTLPIELLPHYIVYRHFLRQVADFGHRADKLEVQHQDSSAFRNYFADKLGITAANSAYITQLAYEYQAEMTTNQAKIKADIERFRAQRPKTIDPSHPPARPRPELAELSRERRAITEKYVHRLQDSLGLDAFEAMDYHIRSTVFIGSSRTDVGNNTAK